MMREKKDKEQGCADGFLRGFKKIPVEIRGIDAVRISQPDAPAAGHWQLWWERKSFFF